MKCVGFGQSSAALGGVLMAAMAQAATVAQAQPSAQQVERQVRQANTEFMQSVVRRNADLYDKRVADDAVFINYGPGKTTKFKTFPSTPPAGMKLQEFKVNNMQVKIEGKTAVVMGRAWTRFSQNGKPGKNLSMFLNVFANRGAGWQLIVGQVNEP
jgi:ketosteroid isomerase-like protein